MIYTDIKTKKMTRAGGQLPLAFIDINWWGILIKRCEVCRAWSISTDKLLHCIVLRIKL